MQRGTERTYLVWRKAGEDGRLHTDYRGRQKVAELGGRVTGCDETIERVVRSAACHEGAFQVLVTDEAAVLLARDHIEIAIAIEISERRCGVRARVQAEERVVPAVARQKRGLQFGQRAVVRNAFDGLDRSPIGLRSERQAPQGRNGRMAVRDVVVIAD